MAKLGVALVKGRTGLPPPVAAPAEAEGAAHASGQADKSYVAPQQFKSLVGKNHPEFGSSRQQVTL